jgi:hypothetical protein
LLTEAIYQSAFENRRVGLTTDSEVGETISYPIIPNSKTESKRDPATTAFANLHFRRLDRKGKKANPREREFFRESATKPINRHHRQ